MPQQHSDGAANVAFQSDIARALARRTGDMPLHSKIAASAPPAVEAVASAPKHDDKEPRP